MHRKKHSVCKVWYHPRFQASTGGVGLRTDLPQIRGTTIVKDFMLLFIKDCILLLAYVFIPFPILFLSLCHPKFLARIICLLPELLLLTFLAG